MTTTNYKGYSISIKQESNPHPDYSYVAYINDVPGGREHVRGCSEENALERLKDRIDNYSSFNQISYMPLTDEKLSELISYVQEHATEIERILRHDHYLLPGRFRLISSAAIYNHFKLIQETLNAADIEFNLDIAFLKNKHSENIDKVLLFDSSYYSTPSKQHNLEDILRNL